MTDLTMTTMSSNASFGRLLRLIAMAALVLACCGSELRAQAVVVMVNGDPITDFDIEQRSKLAELSEHKTPPRQQVIDELIDEKVKIKEAKKYSIDPSSSEIDAAFGQMAGRMRVTGDQLTQTLASKGIRGDTLKSKIRADIVWTSIVPGRFKESMQVSERDVQTALK